jgi:6-phosphogluconolactonase
MKHELLTFDDDAVLAHAAASYVIGIAQQAVAEKGVFDFAVSGGKTPWAMFDELASLDMPWEHTIIYQVDERVAPVGDPDRNLTNLLHSLGTARALVRPMPVNDVDLEGAVREYASILPARLDLVHLGLGPDGHTASLIPDDPVLDVDDQLITMTGPYQGHPRMTMTFLALALADQLLWLITGADKQGPLAKLLDGDTSIPAGRVTAAHSLIMADRSATAR